MRLLSGQEAFAAAVNHGWAHISSALCAEIETANAHLEVLLTKWEATLTAVLVLRDEMKQCADDVAWRALAGRESALPIHEMMRQMQAFMDRGVAQINETRRRSADAVAPPAVEAWLNELHRARMMALELIARSQALLINARFAHVQMFLGVCMLVHGACTHFFTQGRASSASSGACCVVVVARWCSRMRCPSLPQWCSASAGCARCWPFLTTAATPRREASRPQPLRCTHRPSRRRCELRRR